MAHMDQAKVTTDYRKARSDNREGYYDQDGRSIVWAESDPQLARGFCSRP